MIETNKPRLTNSNAKDKPVKIAIVGVGSAGVSVVNLFPKELKTNIKIIKVDHYNNLKIDKQNQATQIDKNQKTTDIEIMYFIDKKVSIEEVGVYLNDPICDKEEILKLLSMVKEGDQIYYMDEWLGCFKGNHFGFKLIRDSKTIMKTKIFKKTKQKSLPTQDKSEKRGWIKKIKHLIRL